MARDAQEIMREIDTKLIFFMDFSRSCFHNKYKKQKFFLNMCVQTTSNKFSF